MEWYGLGNKEWSADSSESLFLQDISHSILSSICFSQSCLVEFVIYYIKNVEKCSSAFDNYINFTFEQEQLLQL